MDGLLPSLLEVVNETLAAAIVVIAASLLLYNISRNRRNRVARTSGAVLACVTAAYLADVFVALGFGPQTYEATLRLQWVGIAFIPAAMLHLSDALLATTGLPSRGRRRRVVRILYLVSVVFLLLAAFTDVLVISVREGRQVGLRAGPLFAVYALYFVIATISAFLFVERARRRCLTRGTRRRMGYLQIAMLTPALGIFPFSVLLTPGQEFSVNALVLVNASNVVVILMMVFLAYPLSFFGSRIPDRVVKAELLRFLMLGPGTGLLALVVIIFTTQATRILSLPGDDFMPFAVVTVVLLWQWIVSLSLPSLERRLIYADADYDQLEKIQQLSQRLLTRADLLQLQEATLSAVCDYLQVGTSFVVALSDSQPELIASIGPTRPNDRLLADESETIVTLLNTDVSPDGLPTSANPPVFKWNSYWIVPLRSTRMSDHNGDDSLIGFIGIQARSAEVNLTLDERQVFRALVRRAAQTLDDLSLQDEIYAALEGLLPQLVNTRARTADVEYRAGRQPALPAPEGTADGGGSFALLDREQFVEQVKAALRHYSAPGLTKSRLLDLNVVRSALPENDNNPAKALRSVLLRAIEKQRPEGERRMTSPEWTIYNILEMRFIDKRSVRDLVRAIALSEPDLYRKQRVAIDAVADALLDMEQSQEPPPANGPQPDSEIS